MKEWKVSYMDKEDDLSHVRVFADDENGAEAQAKIEYHDIDRIIQVVPI